MYAMVLNCRAEPIAMTAQTSDRRADVEALDARWSGLMEAAQAGDARAYATLLGECRPLIQRICRRRLRDSAEAEDAVQDTLLTLHQIRHTYEPARPFRPWLIAIADRRAIDRVRRHARQARNEAAALTSPQADLEPRDIMAERQLRDALRELSPVQRTALHLTKLEDLSLAEASHRSGMTVGALKVATHRAIRSLRLILGRSG